MKVGDYVRTKNGQFYKITDIKPYYENGNLIKENSAVYIDGRYSGWNYKQFEQLIIGSSPNIIDLIEVGDYVNGWRVNRVEKEKEGTLLTIGTITSFVSRSEKEPYLTQDYNEADKMCKIKSIVTKEQFESMQYEVK